MLLCVPVAILSAFEAPSVCQTQFTAPSVFQIISHILIHNPHNNLTQELSSLVSDGETELEKSSNCSFKFCQEVTTPHQLHWCWFLEGAIDLWVQDGNFCGHGLHYS